MLAEKTLGGFRKTFPSKRTLQKRPMMPSGLPGGPAFEVFFLMHASDKDRKAFFKAAHDAKDDTDLLELADEIAKGANKYYQHFLSFVGAIAKSASNCNNFITGQMNIVAEFYGLSQRGMDFFAQMNIVENRQHFYVQRNAFLKDYMTVALSSF